MLLGEARGVEHYIIKRFTYLRSLAVNRLIWEETKELMQMQREIQLEGIPTRKRAIEYVMNKRRCLFHYEMGRVPPGERTEESDMPDEWAAVHYGWASATEDERPDQTESEDSESWSGDSGRAEDERDRIHGDSDAALSASSVPAPVHGKGSKGKIGGKGKSNEPNDKSKDPPMKDDYGNANVVSSWDSKLSSFQKRQGVRQLPCRATPVHALFIQVQSSFNLWSEGFSWPEKRRVVRFFATLHLGWPNDVSIGGHCGAARFTNQNRHAGFGENWDKLWMSFKVLLPIRLLEHPVHPGSANHFFGAVVGLVFSSSCFLNQECSWKLAKMPCLCLLTCGNVIAHPFHTPCMMTSLSSIAVRTNTFCCSLYDWEFHFLVFILCGNLTIQICDSNLILRFCSELIHHMQWKCCIPCAVAESIHQCALPVISNGGANGWHMTHRDQFGFPLHACWDWHECWFFGTCSKLVMPSMIGKQIS